MLLVIYAEGAELENFRLRTFQEQIKIPFGKEEGSLQCSFTAGINENSWTVDISTAGSDTHEAFQIEDDGSLMMKDGTVDVEFSEELQKVLCAIQIRPAIVMFKIKVNRKLLPFMPHLPHFREYLVPLLTTKHIKESSTTNSLTSILLNGPPTFTSKKPKLTIMLGHITKDYVKVPGLVDFFPYQVIVCRAEDLGSYKLLALKLARETLPLIYLTK